jgi:cell division protein FtsL
LLGLGLLALVVHTLFGEHGYVAIRRQEQEVRRLEAEIDRLEEENRKLTTEIKALESDPRAIERVAREQLKMARPGEKVITLPDHNPPEEN